MTKDQLDTAIALVSKIDFLEDRMRSIDGFVEADTGEAIIQLDWWVAGEHSRAVFPLSAEDFQQIRNSIVHSLNLAKQELDKL